MPATYTALIFDMDGVLIDSEPLHERAKRVVFSDYGLSVPDAFYDDVKGKTDHDVFAHALEQHGHDGLDLQELIAAKHAAYEGMLDELELVTGAHAFLERARNGYRLALTTSATRRNQRLAFARFGLDGFFEPIVTAADITKAKPDPEPYRITAERLGLRPEACLVIEDSTNGVRSARAAGCDVAGITTSFSADTLRQAGATVVVDTYDELTDWLERPVAGR